MPVPDSVTSAINDLQTRSKSSQRVSIDERVRLCRQCLDGLAGVIDEWIQDGAQVKQCLNDVSVLAEERLSGPAVIARQLQLTMQTLRAIGSGRNPRLPGTACRLKNGQLAVPVFTNRDSSTA